jgi:DNA-binding response OmpR family regulator
LLVEDDGLLVESLTRGLGAEGYAVDVARNGIDGLHMATETAYDLVILDIMLPGLNGYQVCASLRAGASAVPILMLTAKDGEWDQADGLDGGADDYLTKPFHYPVLLAHMRALLRRGPSRTPPVFQHGPLRLDPATHQCWRADARVELTPREFAVLRYLLSRPDEVITKQELLDHVWGDRDVDHHNVVEVYVSSLRRKIGEPGADSPIETVRGVGYILTDGG